MQHASTIQKTGSSDYVVGDVSLVIMVKAALLEDGLSLAERCYLSSEAFDVTLIEVAGERRKSHASMIFLLVHSSFEPELLWGQTEAGGRIRWLFLDHLNIFGSVVLSVVPFYKVKLLIRTWDHRNELQISGAKLIVGQPTFLQMDCQTAQCSSSGMLIPSAGKALSYRLEKDFFHVGSVSCYQSSHPVYFLLAAVTVDHFIRFESSPPKPASP